MAKQSEEAKAEASSAVAVEFVGTPPYGREFYSGSKSRYTIEKSPAEGKGSDKSFAGMNVDVPYDLVWSAANNWTIWVEPGDLLEALRTQPHLKVRD